MSLHYPANELLTDQGFHDISTAFEAPLASNLETLRGKKGLIIAAGGLAPGVSTVLHNLVGELDGIAEVYGMDNGFAGIGNADQNLCRLIAGKSVPANSPYRTIALDCRSNPGDMPLSMSRGKNFAQDAQMMAHFLITQGFDFIITIGGDGTLKGTQSLEEIIRNQSDRNLQVIHILKTVDGDGPGTSQPFGLSSATDFIRRDVENKNAELRSSDGTVVNLIGCMGRGSGRLALNTASSTRSVDLVIIPEITISAQEIASRINRVVEKNQEGANVLLAEGVEYIPGLTSGGFRGSLDPLADFLRENVHSDGTATKVNARQWDYNQRSPVILNAKDERLINSMTHTALVALSVRARSASVIGPKRAFDLSRPLPVPQLDINDEMALTLIRHGYTQHEIEQAQMPRSIHVTS